MRFAVKMADGSRRIFGSPDPDTFILLAMVVKDSMERQRLMVNSRHDILRIQQRHAEAEELEAIKTWLDLSFSIESVEEIVD